jgi:type IV secretory pathway TrbL component
VAELPAAVQAITDPVAGQVHPGQGPGGPVTGTPTAGGYGNLPYGGQAALTEPGTPGAQDPKGHSAGTNVVRTALFVAAALILLAIAAHLIRMRRAVDDSLAPVGVEQWDRHAAGVDETGQMTTVGSGRGGSDVTRAMAAQRGGADRSGVTRAMPAQRRR